MRTPWLMALAAGAALLAQEGQPPQPPPATQKPPVFRAGAHYVSVDAYPTQEGRLVEGLTRDAFELFEDGKPQAIDTFEFIKADARLPDDERATYLSPREGLELAADPRNRVIVIVLDRAAIDAEGWAPMRDALLEYLRTSVEPRDVLGLTTTDDTWQDLVLGRRLTALEQEIGHPDMLRPRPQEITVALSGCEVGALNGRIRADATYNLLEGLVRLLGQVREDRTSLLFVSNGLSRQGPDTRGGSDRGALPLPPKMGLVNGRIRALPRPLDMHERFCKTEAQRLRDMNFDRRFDELTTTARASNVAFYPVAVPFRVPVMPFGPMFGSRPGRGGMSPQPMRFSNRRPGETLSPLAKQTGGFAVSAIGDVAGGLRRIADDTGSHYLLGYYTTNTKWDGRLRSIKVRLKPGGAEIRARRQYRAPTLEEIASLSAPRGRGLRVVPEPVVNALDALTKARPSEQFSAYGALSGSTLTVTVEVPPAAVAAGRWPEGGALEIMAETAGGEPAGMARGRLAPNGRAVVRVPLAEGSKPPSHMFVRLRADGESITERIEVGQNRSTLVGDPLGYRSGPRGLATPVGSFVFARDERVRLDWAVLAPLERYEARLLDRFGQPLQTRVLVEEQTAGTTRHLIAEITFAPIGRGDYLVDLTAIGGGATEHHLTALRVR